MNVRRGLNIGFLQMESFIRYGLLMDLLKTDPGGRQPGALRLYTINVPFTPPNDDIEFADVSIPELVL
ncbi:unnamed protein product [Gongylonema pulchrum]|uniref:Single-stranded DNA-binding protein n=1 Tax=Gongylonema pulchrum TaxID=637853 RepID=A0A183EM35_9BILA|nr:unnamed protein product [Gongylonema pulchrum]VDN43623.1 unnamed protein product [Gongylonema pulchrum]